MDAEQTDAIDIGVDEHLSEIFKGHVSLANPVVCVAEQENALEIEGYLKKESKDGDCHIFNYQEFYRKPPRNGSEKDAARLQHDFTELNLDVHPIHENLLCEETFNVLREAMHLFIAVLSCTTQPCGMGKNEPVDMILVMSLTWKELKDFVWKNLP